MFATRARRAVENARLSLDATKGKSKNISGQGMNPDEEHLSSERRAEIERKEDEFVGQTEEAVGVMKNVSIPEQALDPLQLLRQSTSLSGLFLFANTCSHPMS